MAPAAVAAIALAGGALLYGLIGNPPAPASSVSYAGSATCAGCHRAQADRWDASQHKVAMQHATDKTVLGDFNDASFDHFGVHSRFFRKDGKFLVETDGADGKLAVFEAKYTFGVEPLQQYLIEFPDGRIQALSIAWDSRPKEQGGQRWFHLYPDEEIGHGDVLHWSGPNQNWNFMCAECHSTGVRRNYDAKTDRFATTWAEISVGCETCHGQGSRHVAWARDRASWWPFGKHETADMGLLVRFDERGGVSWPIDAKTGNGRRNFPPAQLRKEVETCGLCHARRGGFADDWVPGRPLPQTHDVTPISRGLYAADGQIIDREEPYNYTPFKQSAMFAAGVTCSDCHEPHSGKLRVAGEGVCLQCHAADKYAAAAHRHHVEANPAPTCQSCHMVARTYMVVDPRHDHSFRIPRPDVSAKLGTANACNTCHADKPAEWAAAAIEGWFGPQRKGSQNYGEAFHAAWTEQPNAAALLSAVVKDAGTPAVARAGALTELGRYALASKLELARVPLTDPDPAIRIGALAMLEDVPAVQAWPLASRLLSDPVRGVRIRAAALLASVPRASQPAADRDAFEQAAAEFVAEQRRNAERPETRSALATFYGRRGQVADAEAEYRAALRLSPQFAPAAINLADLYRQTARDAEGVAVLRGAIAASPRDAGLHHALGLALVRTKQATEALTELRAATEFDPGQARYAYVYAVALNSSGRKDEALRTLKASVARHPNDRETLTALATLSRDAGDLASALRYAEELGRVAPDDRDVAGFVASLRRQIGASSEPP